MLFTSLPIEQASQLDYLLHSEFLTRLERLSYHAFQTRPQWVTQRVQMLYTELRPIVTRCAQLEA